MKAAQIKSYGPADNIAITETEKPEIVDGKVLVKVRAVGLNPFDSFVRDGNVTKDPKLSEPLTLGGDFAGEVESVGGGDTAIKAGEKVYGTALTLAGGSGALAEYASVPANNLTVMPKNLDFEQAASLPLVGSSAVQAIYDHLNLQSGQKLLVIGASGGIGTVAVQIAKHLGVHTIAGIHGGSVEELLSLGADEVVETDSKEYSELKGIDAVLNLIRGADYEKLYDMMNPSGTIVSLTGIPDDAESNGKNIKLVAQGTATNTEHLDKLRELVEQDAVKPVIAQTFPLEQTKNAYQALESGGKTGKIVVTIK